VLRVSFIMEQHLGHRTYCENLRRRIEADARIDSRWVPVTYVRPDGLLEKLPIPERIRSPWRAYLQVREGLQKFSSDVAFYNTQVPAAISGAVLRSQPYVIATDLTPIQYDALGSLYGHAPDKRGVLKTLKHNINRHIFCSAALLLPWSTWAKESMVADYGVDPAKIEVLPPGVDLAIWRPVQRDQKGPVRILFVGGDFERKGGPTLLRAFQALPVGRAQLHIVTRSRLAGTQDVLVYNNMTPNSPELIALYQQCDVFVLASQAEAFGIATVEATATGLPVIASRGCALAEIVADGETGYLIASGDERALAERLRALVEDPALRLRMGHAARQRAELLFDAKRNAARLTDRLIEIAERQPRHAHG
jgi:glycosyltransferase involved in cell wall biosynthesis